MSEGMYKSEVARLMEQIELENEAARRGFSGPAIVASHEAINKRMEATWDHLQDLIQQVGPEEAHRLTFGEPYPESSPEKGTSCQQKPQENANG